MDEDNSENLELLKNILRENKNILVFVGAGASIPLRIKGWHDILEEMEEEFTGETGKLNDLLCIHGCAGTATIFYKEKNDKKFYHEFLSKQFTHKEGDYFSLQVKILNLFNIILTTNYDTSFEKASDDLNDSRESDGRPRKTCITHYLPHFSPLNLNNPNTTDIVYLHGNNEENNYIFLTEEYEFYYPSVFGNPGNSELEDFLRDIIRQFTIIFIGFSFNDDIFVNFFQNTLQEFMERKIEFKKIHGKEDTFKLPDKFVFHKNAVVTKEEMENLVTDDSWKNLFENPEENELKFKTNIDMETAIEDLKIEENHKKAIINSYKEFTKNLKDKQRLKDDLNLKLISVNQYQDYESILKELFRSLTPATVGDIGDAANAE